MFLVMVVLVLILTLLTAFSTQEKIPEPIKKFMLQKVIEEALISFTIPPSLVNTYNSEVLIIDTVEFVKEITLENSENKYKVNGIVYFKEKTYNNCFVANFYAEYKGEPNTGNLEQIEIKNLMHLFPSDGQIYSIVVGDSTNINTADRHNVFNDFPSNANQELDLIVLSDFENVLKKEFLGQQIPTKLLHKVFDEDTFTVDSVDFVNIISLVNDADSYKIIGIVQFTENKYKTKISAIFSAIGSLKDNFVSSINMDALYILIPTYCRN